MTVIWRTCLTGLSRPQHNPDLDRFGSVGPTLNANARRSWEFDDGICDRSSPCASTLAGTVALPSPYPASGPAFFVLTDWDAEPVIYVKLVQVVNPSGSSPDSSGPRTSGPSDPSRRCGTSDGPERWPVLSLKKIQKEIRQARRRSSRTRRPRRSSTWRNLASRGDPLRPRGGAGAAPRRGPG